MLNIPLPRESKVEQNRVEWNGSRRSLINAPKVGPPRRIVTHVSLHTLIRRVVDVAVVHWGRVPTWIHGRSIPRDTSPGVM